MVSASSQKDLEGRLRELRIPWQAQPRSEEWPDEDQLAADACNAMGRMRNGKAMEGILCAYGVRCAPSFSTKQG